MAGNVTAFNTVFTYDIYQSYIRRHASDAHYLFVGRLTTIFGTLLSLATAYLAARYNNIMDLLQLVFGFVNHFVFSSPDHVAHVARPWRPLFATTAVLLALTEALGSGLAIRLAREREKVS
jgi:Na+/proline symporter